MKPSHSQFRHTSTQNFFSCSDVRRCFICAKLCQSVQPFPVQLCSSQKHDALKSRPFGFRFIRNVYQQLVPPPWNSTPPSEIEISLVRTVQCVTNLTYQRLATCLLRQIRCLKLQVHLLLGALCQNARGHHLRGQACYLLNANCSR